MSHIALRANARIGSVCIIVLLVTGLVCAQSPRSTPSPAQATSPAATPQATVAENLNNTNQASEKVKWTDIGVFIVMLAGVALQLTISVIGFLLVWSQIRLLNRGIRGETHSRLYDHYFKVTERLASQSHLRPYYYSCKELTEEVAGYADLRDEIDMMSEIIAGLLEHATVEKENLPPDSWNACWKAYTQERLQQSVELRKFLRKNSKWYAESFRAVIGEAHPHLVLDCGCEPEDCAGEKEVKQTECSVSKDAVAPNIAA